MSRLSSCGTWAWFLYRMGISPDQGLNPCPLHWQVDSYPLCHQGSPTVFFKSSFRFTKKLKGRYRAFPYIYPCPCTCIVFPRINITHQNDTLVIEDEPTSTHHNHPKSILYLIIHSCCLYPIGWAKCITTWIRLYGVIQMYVCNFHSCKNTLCSAFSFPSTLANH